ncbi:uncharacterized protein V1513DRAFT_166261 [Lipomyces chichibuensis]|uniref:uncharacterized protein n=1 Tax=Lipomyces chichibuensis TaxID=1546026 RepID=UPI0033440571
MPALFQSRKKRTPPASRSAAIAVFGESAFSLIDEDTLSPEESSTLDSDTWMLAYTDSVHSYPDSRRLTTATARSVFDSYHQQPRTRPQAIQSRFASLRRLSSQFTLQQPRSLTGSTTSLNSETGGKRQSLQQAATSPVGDSAPGSVSYYRADPRAVDSTKRHPNSTLALMVDRRHHSVRLGESPPPRPLLRHFATAPLPRAGSTSSTASSTSSSSSSASPHFRPTNSRGRADQRLKTGPPLSQSFSPIPESPRNLGFANSSTSVASAPKRNPAHIRPSTAGDIHVCANDMTTELSSGPNSHSHQRSSFASSSSSSYADVVKNDDAAAAATASDVPFCGTALFSSPLGSPIPSSPRVSSPDSSMIFERQVQDPVLTVSGVPSHHHSENLIPPVLAASCEALTDESVDPEDVEVVSVARPYSNSIHRTNSAVSLASIASSAPSFQAVSPKSSSSTAPSTAPPPTSSSSTHRLSFYTYADVVHDAMTSTDEKLHSPSPDLAMQDGKAPHSPLFLSSIDANAATDIASPLASDSASENSQQQFVTVTTLGEAIRRNQDEITNNA